jgi:hypothetical protein
MDAAQALASLRGAQTLATLKTTIFTFAGRSTSAENDYYLYKDARANADVHDSFKVVTYPAEASQLFRAYSVPMINRVAVPALAAAGGVNLPNAGADMMVTGMLTACTFMYSSDKTNLWCTHLEPARNTGEDDVGLKLGLDVINGGKFAGTADGVRAFTRREYNACHHANVFGVRRGDGWTLYAQGVSIQNKILFAVALN